MQAKLWEREDAEKRRRIGLAKSADRIVDAANALASSIVKVHSLPWSTGAVDAYVTLLKRYEQVVRLLTLADIDRVETALEQCRETIAKVEASANIIYQAGERKGWNGVLEKRYWELSRRQLRLLDQEGILDKVFKEMHHDVERMERDGI